MTNPADDDETRTCVEAGIGLLSQAQDKWTSAHQ